MSRLPLMSDDRTIGRYTVKKVRVGEAPAGGCAFTLDLAAAPFESLAV